MNEQRQEERVSTRGNPRAVSLQPGTKNRAMAMLVDKSRGGIGVIVAGGIDLRVGAVIDLRVVFDDETRLAEVRHVTADDLDGIFRVGLMWV